MCLGASQSHGGPPLTRGVAADPTLTPSVQPHSLPVEEEHFTHHHKVNSVTPSVQPDSLPVEGEHFTHHHKLNYVTPSVQPRSLPVEREHFAHHHQMNLCHDCILWMTKYIRSSPHRAGFSC